MSKVLLKQNKNSRFHVPIMVTEVLENLEINPDGIYVDCTLGGGGHSYEIYKQIEKGKGKLLSLDRDSDAISYVKANYKFDPKKWLIVNEKFSKLAEVCAKYKIKSVDGILVDLGVSSYQLDNPERGFSFQNNGPLDMRMSASDQVRATDLVNALYEKEMTSLFTKYGEERYAKQIASAIIKERNQGPIKTTGQLVNIIKYSVPPAYREGEKHPARRVFQALRMAINSEVEELRELLGQAFSVLQSTGNFVALCFHSLEEKEIQGFMDSQVVQGLISVKTHEPMRAKPGEVSKNYRARSAKLLAYKKL